MRKPGFDSRLRVNKHIVTYNTIDGVISSLYSWVPQGSEHDYPGVSYDDHYYFMHSAGGIPIGPSDDWEKPFVNILIESENDLRALIDRIEERGDHQSACELRLLFAQKPQLWRRWQRKQLYQRFMQ